MPVYNAGEYLRLAVMSIINQSYVHWELIIIDDGSTDNAVQSLSDIDDVRVKIIQDGFNKGLAARLNEIIDMANGDFIARMDQDDLSYPDRFELQLNLLLDHPDLDMVAGRALCISERNEPVGYLPFHLCHKKIVSKPWLGFNLPHPTGMGKTTWFRKHYYACPAPYLCEDQEIILRTFKSSNFSSLDKIILAYRVRDKVELSKLIKTRWAFLNVKLKYFSYNRNFYYLVCCLVEFIFKLLLDLIGVKRNHKNLDGNDFEDFKKIMKEILNFEP